MLAADIILAVTSAVSPVVVVVVVVAGDLSVAVGAATRKHAHKHTKTPELVSLCLVAGE